jgi:WD40 repeat protein
LGPDNFSPDGSRVISLVDGVAEVRDIASGVLVGRLQLDGDDVRVFSARYSRDGSEIISVNTDATVRIWPAP